MRVEAVEGAVDVASGAVERAAAHRRAGAAEGGDRGDLSPDCTVGGHRSESASQDSSRGDNASVGVVIP
jgi:hypothetical protein